LNDNIQKTWSLRPLNVDQAQPDALRINGHKLEDLKLQTKFGRDTYREPSEVLIEIENWIAEDGTPAGKRILVGQNINFDKDMFEQLWKKCNASDTYPFGRRILDTMQIEFFLDFCKGTFAEGYSLNNLIKKYGVKNEKAHTAEADVKATREVFDKQVDIFKKIMKTNA
jgi:DNA polymerase III alpha subunit (gram-positive type)